MVKKFLFAAALLAAAAMSNGADAGSLDKFKPGAKFENDLELPLFSVPLPKGEWKVAYYNDWQDNNKNKLMEVGLTQNDGSTVTDMVIVRTNVDAVSSGWVTTDICSQTSMLHNSILFNTVEKQDCWGVNHQTWKESIDFKPKLGANLQQWAQNLGLSFPHTTLSTFFRLANRSAFVNYHHYVNTATFNIKDPKTGWTESPWHKDRIFEDSKRLSIADQMRDQSETLYLKAKAVGYF